MVQIFVQKSSKCPIINVRIVNIIKTCMTVATCVCVYLRVCVCTFVPVCVLA